MNKQRFKITTKTIGSQQNQIRLVLLGKRYITKGYYWKIGDSPERINMKPILEKDLRNYEKEFAGL